MQRKKLHFALLLRRVEELKALVQNMNKIFYLSVFHLSPNLLICFGDDVMIQLSGDIVILFLPYFNRRRGLNIKVHSMRVLIMQEDMLYIRIPQLISWTNAD